ncbi:Flp family type IVb pilin [Arthrobacter sp. B6]|uniref:Flp family type IVb pilin n=1 Tax=Arthrobacter sp. B6 TaxID=1570137 RepID=UPI00082CB975|nr:Flp family type IVb pilin [Arthrobacter sp. B6]
MKHLTEHLGYIWTLTTGIWAQEKGATATEYGVLVGFVAIVILAGVGLFGTSLNGVYMDLSAGVQTALGIP